MVKNNPLHSPADAGNRYSSNFSNPEEPISCEILHTHAPIILTWILEFDLLPYTVPEVVILFVCITDSSQTPDWRAHLMWYMELTDDFQHECRVVKDFNLVMNPFLDTRVFDAVTNCTLPHNSVVPSPGFEPLRTNHILDLPQHQPRKQPRWGYTGWDHDRMQYMDTTYSPWATYSQNVLRCASCTLFHHLSIALTSSWTLHNISSGYLFTSRDFSRIRETDACHSSCVVSDLGYDAPGVPALYYPLKLFVRRTDTFSISHILRSLWFISHLLACSLCST